VAGAILGLASQKTQKKIHQREYGSCIAISNTNSKYIDILLKIQLFFSDIKQKQTPIYKILHKIISNYLISTTTIYISRKISFWAII
jgi:hypothetical protein